jgi:hypothetical protein
VRARSRATAPALGIDLDEWARQAVGMLQGEVSRRYAAGGSKKPSGGEP